MLRALSVLVAATLLGSSLTACGGSDNGGEDRIAACAKDVAASVLDPIAPGEAPGAKLLEATEALCRDAEDQGLLDDDAVPRSRTRALFQKHGRSIFAPICGRLTTKVRESLPAETMDYVTEAEVRRFASGWCALASDYFRDDASIDVESLLADHPEVGIPLCAAGARAGLEENPQPPIPKRNFGAFGRKLCARLFEERLVEATGPGQFRARSESPKYDRVVRETVEEFAE